MVGDEDYTLRRPRLLIINFILTIVLLCVMILDIIPLGVAFMIAFCIAAIINYPKLKDQQKIISKHAGNALSVAGMILVQGFYRNTKWYGDYAGNGK